MTSQKTRAQERRERESKSCGYCGKRGTHPSGKNFNNVQSVVSTITIHHVEGPESHLKRDRRRTREGQSRNQQDEETSSDSYDDYIYLQETAQNLHRVKKIRSGPSHHTVLICIGDIDAFIEPLVMCRIERSYKNSKIEGQRKSRNLFKLLGRARQNQQHL